MRITLDRLLFRPNRPVHPCYIATYVPTLCGIATFTRDLAAATDRVNPSQYTSEIIAVNDNGTLPAYSPKVTCVINRDNHEDYRKAAEYINKSRNNIVSLQHEYGLFGSVVTGEFYGDYVLDLVEHLQKPLVTTFHTVQPKPGKEIFDITKRILDASSAAVVMLPLAKKTLVKLYGIHPNKVSVLHHGVTLLKPSEKGFKEKLGFAGQNLLLVSGLVNRNKGFEYVIEALPTILQRFPDTHLVILGETHPNVKKREGESYRESLEKLCRDLKVDRQVTFINRYVSLDELLTYFEACDIYLTPHLEPQQITSGTLAYALGMGKATISTKYVYAKDMLEKSKRGMLVDFANSGQIAKAVLQILGNPEFRQQLEKRAAALGRQMSWEKIAQRHLRLFERVIYGAEQ
jgi:glycosyltransferase involved in cell wall biosynthesis